MNTWTIWRRIKLGLRGEGFIFSSILVLGLVSLAVLGPELAPHNPFVRNSIQIIDGELIAAPIPPNKMYPLGTDAFGRDILSLLLYGARQTLSMALIATVLRVLLGATLGLLAGWNPGNWIDRSAMVITEFLSAIPGLILAMLLVFAIGVDRGQIAFIATVSIVGIGEIIQTVRGQVLSIRSQEFIQAARSIGQTETGILSGHVLPNLLPLLLALAALQMGNVLLLLSELGFLGVFIGGGGQYSTLNTGTVRFFTLPDWGAMLGTLSPYFRSRPWLPLTPAVAVFISVLSFNLFGHGLQRFIERGRFHPSGWSVLRLLLVIGAILTGIYFVLRGSGVEAYYVDLAAQFDEERTWDDLIMLTSPPLDGRAAGSEGATLAAGYISNQFEAAGLTPQSNGSYFQPYDGLAGYINWQPKLEVLDANGEVIMTIEDGLGFNPLVPFSSHVSEQDEMVIAANITQRLNHGGIVFLLNSNEDIGANLWGRVPHTAVIGIVPDDTLILRDRPPAVASGGPFMRSTPHLLIRESAAEKIFAAAGESLTDLQTSALGEEEIRLKPGLQLRLTVSVDYEEYSAFNVVGYLPAAGTGTGRRILVLAPYTAPAPYSDIFFPNADGNASGVAVMLEIMRLLRDVNYQPKETIVFAALDQGGGSEFMLHPILPTAVSDTWTVVILDGLGAGDSQLARIETGGSYAAMLDSSSRRLGMRTTGLEDWSYFEATGGGYSAFLEGNDQYSGIAITRPDNPYSGTVNDNAATINRNLMEEAGRVIAHFIMVLSS